MSLAKRRHAEYYLIQARQQKNSNWFVKKWPQVSQAGEWVLKNQTKSEFLFEFVFTMNSFLSQYGPWRTGLSWNNRARKHALRAREDNAQLEASLNIAWFANSLGDRKRAVENLQHSLTLAKRLKQPSRQASILNSLGAIDFYMGRFSHGRAALKRALGLREAIEDAYGKGLVLNNLAESYLMQKNAKRALPYLEQAEALFSKQPGDESYSLVINNLAGAEYALGRFEQARVHLEEALKLRVMNRDLPGELSTRNNLAIIHLRNKEYPAALDQFKKALQAARKLGYRRGEAIALNNIGYFYLELNKKSRAITSFTLALEISQSIKEHGTARTASEGIRVSSGS